MIGLFPSGRIRRALVTPALLAVLAAPAQALAAEAGQTALTWRGVPQGAASPTPLTLSLADAVRRGLAQNLAVVIQEQERRAADGARLAAWSRALPQVTASVRQSQQVLSTAAFGFTLPDMPVVIGPFGVFDARVSLSMPLFDARVLAGLRGADAVARAGAAQVRSVRESVVLAVGTLYLQAAADTARVTSVRAQVDTARALAALAEDQRAAGLVAGIDVVRQQLQLESARARLIAAENTAARRLLALARAVGVPAGQAIVLSDTPAFTAAPMVAVEQAVGEAALHREDVRAAQARVEAARAARRAEASGQLPTLHLDADVGAIGARASDLDRTHAVAAVVRVPLFDGGQIRARVRQADAVLQEREAELADLVGGLRYDIEGALLDIHAAEAAVAVADSARRLAAQELEQARDRFAAGVSTTLELAQAQEMVAGAAEQYIASVYAHAVAKGAYAHAIGQVEQRFVALVGGTQ